MPLNIHWDSCKGKRAVENQDAGGVATQDTHCLVMIADGVSQRLNSAILAHELVRHVIDQSLLSKGIPTGDDVIAWLQHAHRLLAVQRLGAASASFLIACIAQQTLLFTVHAGDCRLGEETDSGPIKWLTPIHSLATALAPVDESLLAETPGRNQLTRTFSCRRFKYPEHLIWKRPLVRRVILATDGFWLGLPALAQVEACGDRPWIAVTEQDDDASCLVICDETVLIGFSPSNVANIYIRSGSGAKK